jgi:hypothetical protein
MPTKPSRCSCSEPIVTAEHPTHCRACNGLAPTDDELAELFPDPEALSCVSPHCLVNHSLCDANGLCGVHAHAHALEVEHYTYEGATLAYLDPFQPTMWHSTRAGIFGAERAEDLSCALDAEDVGHFL